MAGRQGPVLPLVPRPQGRCGRAWLADRDAYVTQQGDQHLGNIGTYLAAGEFGTLGFGMVDFDDSQTLPFQFELLQGVISLRLAAEGPAST